MFVYDFPVVKCNQVELWNCYSCELTAHIQVPFKIVASLNMRNRHIVVEINKCPQVCLKKIQERDPSMSSAIEKNTAIDDNSLWLDCIQNSPIHKVWMNDETFQLRSSRGFITEFRGSSMLVLSYGP